MSWDPVFASAGLLLPPPRDLVGVGLRSETGLLVLGEEVAFLRGDDEEIVACPAHFLLVRDLGGDVWNPCDLYVLPTARSLVGIGKAMQTIEEEARDYYGSGTKLTEVNLAKPSGSWQSRGQVDTIWYRRKGKHKGRYTHRFAFPIALQAQGERAYRLRLPAGCVANDRGIVWP